MQNFLCSDKTQIIDSLYEQGLNYQVPRQRTEGTELPQPPSISGNEGVRLLRLSGKNGQDALGRGSDHDHEVWQASAKALLKKVFGVPHEFLNLFCKQERAFNTFNVSAEGKKTIFVRQIEMIEKFATDLEQQLPVVTKMPATPDSTAVFVVHGRNEELRKSMFDFLRAIGLKPIEWTQALAATEKGAPFVGEVLDAVFSRVQVVIVLLSPDDNAELRAEFRKDSDPDYERQLTGQARPNVIFEAGMAFGRCPNRTILVEVGTLRPFSDVAGRHSIRIDNTAHRRQDLAMRLKAAGCSVDTTGTDWLSVGNFELKPGQGQKLPFAYQSIPRRRSILL